MTDARDRAALGEAPSEDRTRTVTAVMAGAFLGCIVAYFTLTPRGRRIEARLNPTLDDLIETLGEIRRAIRKVGDVVEQAGAALEDVRTAISPSDAHEHR